MKRLIFTIIVFSMLLPSSMAGDGASSVTLNTNNNQDIITLEEPNSISQEQFMKLNPGDQVKQLESSHPQVLKTVQQFVEKDPLENPELTIKYIEKISPGAKVDFDNGKLPSSFSIHDNTMTNGHVSFDLSKFDNRYTFVVVDDSIKVFKKGNSRSSNKNLVEAVEAYALIKKGEIQRSEDTGKLLVKKDNKIFSVEKGFVEFTENGLVLLSGARVDIIRTDKSKVAIFSAINGKLNVIMSETRIKNLKESTVVFDLQRGSLLQVFAKKDDVFYVGNKGHSIKFKGENEQTKVLFFPSSRISTPTGNREKFYFYTDKGTYKFTDNSYKLVRNLDSITQGIYTIEAIEEAKIDTQKTDDPEKFTTKIRLYDKTTRKYRVIAVNDDGYQLLDNSGNPTGNKEKGLFQLLIKQKIPKENAKKLGLVDRSVFSNKQGEAALTNSLYGLVDYSNPVIPQGGHWFDPRRYGGHTGVDLAVPIGTPVKSAGYGTVENTEWKSGYGWTVTIDHGNGIKTFYAHLNIRSNLPVGTRVNDKTVIARSGETEAKGRPHLHLMCFKNNIPLNPATCIKH